MLRPTLKLIFLVTTLLSLTACVPKYHPDLNGKPVARVRMQSTHPYTTYAAVLITGSCIPYDSSEWENTSQVMSILWPTKDVKGSDKIGMPFSKATIGGVYTEQNIRAGLPIALEFYAFKSKPQERTVCAVGLSFIPEEGGDYEAHFSQDQNGNKCVMTLQRLMRTNDGAVELKPVPDIKQINKCQ